MKRLLLYLCGFLFLASCSSPKFAYNFDHHDYNAGRRTKEMKRQVAVAHEPEVIQAEQLVASLAPTVITSEPASSISMIPATVNPTGKSFTDLSRSERRQVTRNYFRELKRTAIKKDGVESVSRTKYLDHDLKLSIIFGAVGVTGLFIGGFSGPAYVFTIIGAIALIIGVVFFIKWLMRQ